ncbi:hypothetical protein LTR36_010961 [Oleoguttula mirabilis]|uniref:Heterokaryon incompatibility domain-containing protein n=1 Tax=Oleoguttula mirabilis TaxID=1507867 RepID=A0AAV9J3N4_9PEZI|nr:hypothetical protein LTR36_010961 [Oleoguttula mirabilis]
MPHQRAASHQRLPHKEARRVWSSIWSALGGSSPRTRRQGLLEKQHSPESEQSAKAKGMTAFQHMVIDPRSHPGVMPIMPRPAVDEAQARQAARANNARYYNRDLSSDDEIRLLRLEPGDGPISGSLEYASLLEPAAFDALSYCWGEQKSFQQVTIDGRDGFLVSEHLYAALRRLRRPDKPRLVWIDVICVNQSNVPERNRSVELMWRIYTEARRVIIWIGEIDAQRPTCKRLYPGAKEEDSQLTLCARSGLAALEHGNLTAKLSERLQDMEFESSRGSAGEVWWKRLWIIQEFSCAKQYPTVYLGPHAIGWDFFSELMHTNTHDRLTLFHHLRTQEDQNLLQLLLMAKIFHCSDKRDRIYALLGLAKEGPMRIVPDYSKPVSQVYEEAALYLIKEEQNLDVLLDERLVRTDDECASWVPDFTLLRPRDLVRTIDMYAAGDLVPVVELVDAPSTSCSKCNKSPPLPRALQLRALYFDRIVARTREDTLPAPDISRRPIMARHFHKPALSRPLQTAEQILEHLKINFKSPAPFGLDRAPSIGYLMLEYLFNGTRSVVSEFERAGREKPWVHHPNMSKLSLEKFADKFGMELTDAVKDDLMMSTLWESAFLWTRHTRTYTPDENSRAVLGGQEMYQVSAKTYKKDFFSTANGFIGLGPESLEVGDVVIVPFGASRPLVLRDHGGHHVLVGDAVVPGIMSGQLVNLFQEGTVEARDFLLL